MKATSFRQELGLFDSDEVEVQIWDGADPAIVMLHDGLGSVSQWRDLPLRLSEQTGSLVIAYNRAGHGSSTPVPSGPWPTSWMHDEADKLGQLLATVRVDRPLILGHSDGASIGLLAAVGGLDVMGVLALAPHSFVESVCVEAIAAMGNNRQRIVEALSRHHQYPGPLFDAWSGVWVSAEFASWDIRPQLSALDAPCVVVQGDVDEYATDLQVEQTVAAINVGGVAGPVRTTAAARRWNNVGHLLHHDAPDRIVAEVRDLLAKFGD